MLDRLKPRPIITIDEALAIQILQSAGFTIIKQSHSFRVLMDDEPVYSCDIRSLTNLNSIVPSIITDYYYNQGKKAGKAKIQKGLKELLDIK